MSIADASDIEAQQNRQNKRKGGGSTPDSLIKSTDYSGGNSHDSNQFIGLLSGEVSIAYADGAYQS